MPKANSSRLAPTSRSEAIIGELLSDIETLTARLEKVEKVIPAAVNKAVADINVAALEASSNLITRHSELHLKERNRTDSFLMEMQQCIKEIKFSRGFLERNSQLFGWTSLIVGFLCGVMATIAAMAAWIYL